MTVTVAAYEVHDTQRHDAVLTLHRLAVRRRRVAPLLHWLADHTGCWVALVDRAGSVLRASSDTTDEVLLGLVAEGVRMIQDRQVQSVTIDDAGYTMLVFVLDDLAVPSRPVFLTVLGWQPVPAGVPAMAADAIWPLALSWRAELIAETQRRVSAADARTRQAVLYLLMNGMVASARQVAAALRPGLPRSARVYVIECAAKERDDVVAICARVTDERAWIVRCPVYTQHVIAIAPANEPLDGAIVRQTDACVVGVSEALPLQETSTAYAQAIHALAVARRDAARRARFGARPQLATLLGTAGTAWADDLLRPLLEYRPTRADAPTADELIATARSWLTFRAGASRHLRIHRNTVAVRMRRIEQLLGLDLRRVSDQSILSIALRLHDLPPCVESGLGDEPVRISTVEDLLRLPAVRHWANSQLRPVLADRNGRGLATLRCWLDHDTALHTTAAALRVSAPGLRKRLVRLEQDLRCSLVHPPDARHDLWLALSALDQPAPPQGEGT